MTTALLKILAAVLSGFFAGCMVRWLYLGETMSQTWASLHSVL